MNSTLCISLCAGLLAAFPSAAPPGDEGEDGKKPALVVSQDKEFRILNLVDWVRPFVCDSMPQLGLEMGQGRLQEMDTTADRWESGYPAAPMLFDTPGKSPFDIEGLIEEARMVDPEGWEAEGASIEGRSSGRVFMTNKAETLDRVATTLEQMRLTIAPRLNLRYVAWEAEGGDAKFQVLGQDAAGRMYENAVRGQMGRVVHFGSAQCRAGDRVHMGLHGRKWSQGDLNVEVATSSKIGDPVIEALRTGQGMSCLPLVQMDGKSLALFCFFSWREVHGLEGQDLVSTGLKQVELAEVAQAQTAFSVGIPSGGGVLLSPGGLLEPGLRVLLAVDRADPMPRPQEAPVFVPAGLVTSPLFRKFQFARRKSAPGVSFENPVEMDDLVDLCRSMAGPGADEGNLDLRMGPMHLSIGGRGDALAAARRTAFFVTKDLGRSFVVEVVQEGRPLDQPASEWKELGAPITIPCLSGRVGFALHGVERSYVADYDVEIAQKANIADPVIASVFDGAQLVAGVDPAGPRCRVELMLLARAVGDMRRVSSGAKDVGTVWCPEEQEVTTKRAVTLKPGETQPLGEGPVREFDGRPHRTRLVLKLTEL